MLAAVLLVAAPSATSAQKAKGGPELVGDGLSQVLVPFQSIGASTRSAAPAKAKKARKGKRSKKAKTKRPSKTMKKKKG